MVRSRFCWAFFKYALKRVDENACNNDQISDYFSFREFFFQQEVG